MSPTTSWSADEVLASLRDGDAVRDAVINDALALRPIADSDQVRQEIRFVNCRLDSLDIACLQFNRPVAFEDCSFGQLMAFATYFLAGLRIERCTFESRTDLSCGGHNQNGSTVALTECEFSSFVDFSDCWFEGPVVITRCSFTQGTNLLGNQRRPYAVRFDVPPTIEGNAGTLEADD